ncbi:MAG: hypothetical protein JST92_27080, partial [Deltaproteobacteria bacterium]|nr:hypothetical protein [Deltaproteobacteria bacterium]
KVKPVLARASFQGALVRYKPLDTACATCHADPHAGQFAAERSCEACHGFERWAPERFVHAAPFTNFTLDGKHAEAACEKCHVPVATAAGLEVRRFKGTPSSCEGCHQDPHHGAFQRFVK